MGFIKAFKGAIGGTLADQWEDFIVPMSGVPATAGVYPAVAKGTNVGRGANTKGSNNIISNGSKIVVPEGTALITMQEGAITGGITEPGGFIFTSNDPDAKSLSYNPSNATNKIVTWSSSDESVATVDNGGKITPKKIGSTIITVTSQDGSKKATCTVTVVEASNNNNNNKGNSNTGTTNNGSSDKTSTDQISYDNGGKEIPKDTTMATGKLPQTGVEIGLILSIISLIGGSVFAYIKYNKLRGI